MLERMLVALMTVLIGVVGAIIFTAWWIHIDISHALPDCGEHSDTCAIATTK